MLRRTRRFPSSSPSIAPDAPLTPAQRADRELVLAAWQASGRSLRKFAVLELAKSHRVVRMWTKGRALTHGLPRAVRAKCLSLINRPRDADQH